MGSVRLTHNLRRGKEIKPGLGVFSKDWGNETGTSGWIMDRKEDKRRLVERRIGVKS